MAFGDHGGSSKAGSRNLGGHTPRPAYCSIGKRPYRRTRLRKTRNMALGLSMEEWAIVGIFIAAVAAVASLLTASLMRRDIRASILSSVVRSHSSPDMFDAMTELAEWKEAHGQVFAAKFKDELSKKSSKGEELDNARRICTHHFYHIWRLYDSCLARGEFVRKLTTLDQVSFLLEVLEPLEKEKNPKYNQQMFDDLRNIFQEGAAIASHEVSKEKHVDQTWKAHRAALLGVWLSVYISFYVYSIVRNPPSGIVEGLVNASIAFFFATLITASFRWRTLREAFFGFFDWIAGIKKIDIQTVLFFGVSVLVVAILVVFF